MLGPSEKYVEASGIVHLEKDRKLEIYELLLRSDGDINSLKPPGWAPIPVNSAGAKRKKKSLMLELVDVLGGVIWAQNCPLSLWLKSDMGQEYGHRHQQDLQMCHPESVLQAILSRTRKSQEDNIRCDIVA